MIQYIRLCSLIAALLIVANAALFAASVDTNISGKALDQLVTLAGGTVVHVVLNEIIDAESVSVGNSIDLLVRSNVVVNGKILIAAGAQATGWVKSVQRNRKCSEITITVENAMSVDGQLVNLRSIPCVIKAGSGDDTSATIGTSISARVLNDTKINA